MNRRSFLEKLGLAGLVLPALHACAQPAGNAGTASKTLGVPEQYFFKDDGKIPNNKLPLLLYHHILAPQSSDAADWVNALFAKNNWTNSWVDGVYPFHHYHSTTHEVLGVYAGSAVLQLGGEKGKQLHVAAGDVIIIPAGVGHKRVSADDAFGVVGAYPDGHQWDLLRGLPGERPQADKNIAAQPIPDQDPVGGSQGELMKIWGSIKA